MAATLIFGALSGTALGFMVRFLAAISGPDGRAARIAFAVKVNPDAGSGDGGYVDEEPPKSPISPVPLAPRIPGPTGMPVWQHSRLHANASKSNGDPLPRGWEKQGEIETLRR